MRRLLWLGAVERKPMSMRPPIQIVDAVSSFAELDGATLQWWYLLSSHGEFCLRASGAARGLAAIHFWGTRFIDCPVKMHHARLRLATEPETEALRPYLPLSQADYLRREEHVVVVCAEGTYSIQARKVTIRWEGDPGFLQTHLGDVDLAAPLWLGGPRLTEL
jgi:hypothetical protein